MKEDEYGRKTGKEKGNFWLTVASFIVNKRKAIEILFVLAIIYSVLSINKVRGQSGYHILSAGRQ